MFLALDVGNTQTTYGLIAEKSEELDAMSLSGEQADGKKIPKLGEVLQRWRTQTSPNDTADELAIRLHELFECSPFNLKEVSAVGISCVVPALFHAWKTAVSRLGLSGYLIQATDFLDAGLIASNIGAPETIGADRLANAAEAKRKYGAPAIVVDFGTATNIEVVDEHGYFVGGSISPGLMLSAQALFGKAGMLTDVPIQMPRHAIGTTSAENIQAGLVLGWAGLVNELVEKMKKELGVEENGKQKCAVIGTGGLMSIMSEATDCFTALDSDLTLRGIYYLSQMHKEQSH